MALANTNFRSTVLLAAITCLASAALPSTASAQQGSTTDQSAEKPVLRYSDTRQGGTRHLSYEITVLAGGRALYKGGEQGKDFSEINFQVSPQSLKNIEKVIKKSGFLSVRGEHTLTVVSGKQQIDVNFERLNAHTVRFNVGVGPIAILEVLNAILEEINVDRFRCPVIVSGRDICAEERENFRQIFKLMKEQSK